MLTIDEVVAAILSRAEDRYEVYFPNATEVAASWTDINSIAIQLKRVNREGAGWRTVLITAFSYDVAKVQGAFRWAADVRDNLAEPQTADLYMFMLIEGVTSEDAARLETDDRFCRKVVVREGEIAGSFLDRSFLATLSPSGSLESISDPLLASMGTLGLTHSWVLPHLEAWRELLLSGQSGSDVADALKVVAFGEEDSQ
ncbi:ABC-three component system middle component 1 [Pseudomonas alliivorans]|nr:ABC-three component system middle component 1 [Pseudomonas alliivorans]